MTREKAEATDAAAIDHALSRGMADYRYSMLIGMVVNAWIGLRVAGSLDLLVTWIAAAVFPIGFALAAWSAFQAHRLDDLAAESWRRAKLVYTIGTLLVAAAIAVLVACAMGPSVPTGTALLAGLDALAVMGTIADAAAGRLRVANVTLVLIGLAMAVPLAVGSPDMMRHTAAFGVVGHTLVCLGIARGRHQKEFGLFAAQLAERAALAANQAADERLRAALRLMPQGVMIVSGLDGQVQFINQRLRDLLGLAPDAAPLGSSWAEVFRQASRISLKTPAGRQGLIERSAELARAARGGGSSVLRLDDGRVLDVEFRPVEESGGVLVVMRDATEEVAVHATLMREARRCPLTGLANRRALDEDLRKRLAEAEPLVLVLADLKGFKTVNDSYGHPIGDQVLTLVGIRLKTAVPQAFVARLGGDDFAVIAQVPTAGAAIVAAAVLEALRGRFDLDDLRIETEGRVGYAIAPRDGDNGVDLLRRADLALIAARQNPATPVVRFAPALEAAMRDQRDEEAAVAAVLAEGRVGVALQPWFRLADGRALGVEALARWPAEEALRLTPQQFVTRVEAMGRSASLRRQVMAQAMAALADSDLELAVNISAIELAQSDFADQVLACAADHGFPLERLVLEVTESAIHANLAQSAEELGRLRRHGAHVAVDDFGSGFSALSALAQLPIDRLKIDRSLLLAPPTEGGAHVLLAAAVAIGQGLGLGVVVEGVERDEQLQAAIALGADQAQGFLLARPLALAAVTGPMFAAMFHLPGGLASMPPPGTRPH